MTSTGGNKTAPAYTRKYSAASSQGLSSTALVYCVLLVSVLGLRGSLLHTAPTPILHDTHANRNYSEPAVWYSADPNEEVHGRRHQEYGRVHAGVDQARHRHRWHIDGKGQVERRRQRMDGDELAPTGSATCHYLPCAEHVLAAGLPEPGPDNVQCP